MQYDAAFLILTIGLASVSRNGLRLSLARGSFSVAKITIVPMAHAPDRYSERFEAKEPTPPRASHAPKMLPLNCPRSQMMPPVVPTCADRHQIGLTIGNRLRRLHRNDRRTLPMSAGRCPK
jgi:hypothetical protein